MNNADIVSRAWHRAAPFSDAENRSRYKAILYPAYVRDQFLPDSRWQTMSCTDMLTARGTHASPSVGPPVKHREFHS